MDPFNTLDPEWADALFESAPAPMAVIGANHRILRCNAAYCNLTGYSKAELLARTWQSITHPDDVDGDQSAADAVQRDSGHPTYTIAKRYLTKRGETVWIDLHVQGIWHEGVFRCYFVTAVKQAPARCDNCPANGHRVASRENFIEWAKRNPKDAAIIVLAGAAFLGRDEAVSLLKSLLK